MANHLLKYLRFLADIGAYGIVTSIYTSDWNYYVQHGDVRSSTHVVVCGIHQGLVLVPLFFLIYILRTSPKLLINLTGLGSSTVLVLKYIFISTWCTWVLGVWKCQSTCTCTCTWPKSTWYLQVIFKYYLLKSVKRANYLNTLL